MPNSTYAPILIGSILALVMQDERGFAVLFRLFGYRWSAPALFLGVVILAATLPADLRGLPNLALHLAMAAGLASLTLREDNGLAPVMQWQPLARVGQISYGLYLYHLFALHATNAIMGRIGADTPWAVLIVYAILSVAMAEVSYRTLEAWFRSDQPKVPVQPSLA